MSTWFSVSKTLLLSLVVELGLFVVIQQGHKALNMSHKFLGRHFLRDGGGRSGNGGRRLRGRGLFFLLGTVLTKVSSLSASEA